MKKIYTYLLITTVMAQVLCLMFMVWMYKKLSKDIDYVYSNTSSISYLVDDIDRIKKSVFRLEDVCQPKTLSKNSYYHPAQIEASK